MTNRFVSVIVRSRNEEKWIGSCIRSIRGQSFAGTIEIVLVDNVSSDETIRIAEREGIDQLISIADYTPGAALNAGIRAARGDNLCIISSHCLAVNDLWIEALLSSLSLSPDTAGVYGRQLPLAHSSDLVKRELGLVFGPECRMQREDPMFHNANSIIRRSVWEQFPFDESITNIEDRAWAQRVQQEGYVVRYEPAAMVFHHNGLHTKEQSLRLSQTARIIEANSRHENQLPGFSGFDLLSDRVAVFMVLSEKITDRQAIVKRIKNFLDSRGEDADGIPVYVTVSREEDWPELEGLSQVWLIQRDEGAAPRDSPLGVVMHQSLLAAETLRSSMVEIGVFVNPEYDYLSWDTTLQAIELLATSDFDTVFPATPEYGHMWIRTDGSGVRPLHGDILSRDFSPRDTYRALYGLGTASRRSVLLQRRLVGDACGVVPLSDERQAMRTRFLNVGMS